MISAREIPRVIDISAVRADVTHQELEDLAKIAQAYHFICVFTMPCFTEKMRQMITAPTVLVGGVAGFPSGADCTEEKVACAKRMVSLGCDEVDMVVNIGALKSGDYNKVEDDIRSVVKAVQPLPVKAILEVSLLTEAEIKIGAQLAVKAGVTFVKTGTGWAGPTTVEHIQWIRGAIGNGCSVKAAGGIRTLADLEEMVDAGCNRFGVSAKSALVILKEAYDREGVPFPDV